MLQQYSCRRQFEKVKSQKSRIFNGHGKLKTPKVIMSVPTELQNRQKSVISVKVMEIEGIYFHANFSNIICSFSIF